MTGLVRGLGDGVVTVAFFTPVTEKPKNIIISLKKFM